jgi:hypothetical protein
MAPKTRRQKPGNPIQRPTTGIAILAPRRSSLLTYYVDLDASWIPLNAVGGSASSVVWTLSFGGAPGPLPRTKITIFRGNLYGVWIVPGNLVPFDPQRPCVPVSAVLTVTGKAAGKTFTASTPVKLVNGGCWIN